MRRTLRTLGIAAVVIVLGATAGYAAYVSTTSPNDPCASVQVMLTPARVSGVAPPTDVIASPGDPVPPPPAGPVDGQHPEAPATGAIPVVAAENFWGSLVAQLGGNQTSVLSIVNDPNADPHEFEANTAAAVAIAGARLVVVNGVGYDNWALQLIAAENNPSQVVLNVGSLNGVTVGAGLVAGNPHMWYNPVDVNRTVAAMYSALVQISPGEVSYFQQQYASLNASLATLYAYATAIRDHFAGTVVAATEDIFVYLANYSGLRLISPPEFMQAVSEGNDPPAQSVVAFQCQLESGNVKVMVYNQQTVTPITTAMQSIATQHNVTILGITETIQPPTATFQAWMGAELFALYNALNARASGP